MLICFLINDDIQYGFNSFMLGGIHMSCKKNYITINCFFLQIYVSVINYEQVMKSFKILQILENIPKENQMIIRINTFSN